MKIPGLVYFEDYNLFYYECTNINGSFWQRLYSADYSRNKMKKKMNSKLIKELANLPSNKYNHILLHKRLNIKKLINIAIECQRKSHSQSHKKSSSPSRSKSSSPSRSKSHSQSHKKSTSPSRSKGNKSSSRSPSRSKSNKSSHSKKPDSKSNKSSRSKKTDSKGKKSSSRSPSRSKSNKSSSRSPSRSKSNKSSHSKKTDSKHKKKTESKSSSPSPSETQQQPTQMDQVILQLQQTNAKLGEMGQAQDFIQSEQFIQSIISKIQSTNNNKDNDKQNNNKDNEKDKTVNNNQDNDKQTNNKDNEKQNNNKNDKDNTKSKKRALQNKQNPQPNKKRKKNNNDIDNNLINLGTQMNIDDTLINVDDTLMNVDDTLMNVGDTSMNFDDDQSDDDQSDDDESEHDNDEIDLKPRTLLGKNKKNDNNYVDDDEYDDDDDFDHDNDEKEIIEQKGKCGNITKKSHNIIQKSDPYSMYKHHLDENVNFIDEIDWKKFCKDNDLNYEKRINLYATDREKSDGKQYKMHDSKIFRGNCKLYIDNISNNPHYDAINLQINSVVSAQIHQYPNTNHCVRTLYTMNWYIFWDEFVHSKCGGIFYLISFRDIGPGCKLNNDILKLMDGHWGTGTFFQILNMDCFRFGPEHLRLACICNENKDVAFLDLDHLTERLKKFINKKSSTISCRPDLSVFLTKLLKFDLNILMQTMNNDLRLHWKLSVESWELIKNEYVTILLILGQSTKWRGHLVVLCSNLKVYTIPCEWVPHMIQNIYNRDMLKQYYARLKMNEMLLFKHWFAMIIQKKCHPNSVGISCFYSVECCNDPGNAAYWRNAQLIPDEIPTLKMISNILNKAEKNKSTKSYDDILEDEYGGTYKVPGVCRITDDDLDLLDGDEIIEEIQKRTIAKLLGKHPLPTRWFTKSNTNEVIEKESNVNKSTQMDSNEHRMTTRSKKIAGHTFESLSSKSNKRSSSNKTKKDNQNKRKDHRSKDNQNQSTDNRSKDNQNKRKDHQSKDNQNQSTDNRSKDNQNKTNDHRSKDHQNQSTDNRSNDNQSKHNRSPYPNKGLIFTQNRPKLSTKHNIEYKMEYNQEAVVHPLVGEYKIGQLSSLCIMSGFDIDDYKPWISKVLQQWPTLGKLTNQKWCELQDELNKIKIDHSQTDYSRNQFIDRFQLHLYSAINYWTRKLISFLCVPSHLRILPMHGLLIYDASYFYGCRRSIVNAYYSAESTDFVTRSTKKMEWRLIYKYLTDNIEDWHSHDYHLRVMASFEYQTLCQNYKAFESINYLSTFNAKTLAERIKKLPNDPRTQLLFVNRQLLVLFQQFGESYWNHMAKKILESLTYIRLQLELGFDHFTFFPWMAIKRKQWTTKFRNTKHYIEYQIDKEIPTNEPRNKETSARLHKIWHQITCKYTSLYELAKDSDDNFIKKIVLETNATEQDIAFLKRMLYRLYLNERRKSWSYQLYQNDEIKHIKNTLNEAQYFQTPILKFEEKHYEQAPDGDYDERPEHDQKWIDELIQYFNIELDKEYKYIEDDDDDSDENDDSDEDHNMNEDDDADQGSNQKDNKSEDNNKPKDHDNKNQNDNNKPKDNDNNKPKDNDNNKPNDNDNQNQNDNNKPKENDNKPKDNDNNKKNENDDDNKNENDNNNTNPTQDSTQVLTSNINIESCSVDIICINQTSNSDNNQMQIDINDENKEDQQNKMEIDINDEPKQQIKQTSEKEETEETEETEENEETEETEENEETQETKETKETEETEETEEKQETQQTKETEQTEETEQTQQSEQIQEETPNQNDKSNEIENDNENDSKKPEIHTDEHYDEITKGNDDDQDEDGNSNNNNNSNLTNTTNSNSNNNNNSTNTSTQQTGSTHDEYMTTQQLLLFSQDLLDDDDISVNHEIREPNILNFDDDLRDPNDLFFQLFPNDTDCNFTLKELLQIRGIKISRDLKTVIKGFSKSQDPNVKDWLQTHANKYDLIHLIDNKFQDLYSENLVNELCSLISAAIEITQNDKDREPFIETTPETQTEFYFNLDEIILDHDDPDYNLNQHVIDTAAKNFPCIEANKLIQYNRKQIWQFFNYALDDKQMAAKYRSKLQQILLDQAIKQIDNESNYNDSNQNISNILSENDNDSNYNQINHNQSSNESDSDFEVLNENYNERIQEKTIERISFPKYKQKGAPFQCPLCSKQTELEKKIFWRFAHHVEKKHKDLWAASTSNKTKKRKRSKSRHSNSSSANPSKKRKIDKRRSNFDINVEQSFNKNRLRKRRK